ncbi:ATP-binding protein [Paenibacillus tritici]|uniref:AlbA family DNA-binding domain-containing protein n=1 Tax=Paenibacillus tritici TaxID=1873425 RepID=UPI001BAC6F7C|nr:ATP-binding protein [Paenibacillus tritici]QUL57058.1 ATP-binding protein [Paenibacillus tritici]
MSLFHKDFDAISEVDLQLLIDSGIIEGQHLEYKREITRLVQLQEEVAAFANSQGGDLVIGIEEKDGRPVELIGVELDSPDKEILRLSNSLCGGLDPEYNMIRIRTIQLQNDRYIIFIRTPRSWNAPHMIKENYKFMLRTNGNKIPVGTSELRRLLTGRHDYVDKYEKFRVERVIKTTEHFQLPVPFIIMHSVPLSAFEVNRSYPIHSLKRELNHAILGDDYKSSTPTINAHGTIYKKLERYGPLIQGGHTQLFLNGIIEQVSNYPFTHSTFEDLNIGLLNFFHTAVFKERLNEALEHNWITYKKIRMHEPFFIFFSLIGIKGIKGFNRHPNMYGKEPIVLDDDLLYGPEILIEGLNDTNKENAVNSLVNFIWNAFGFEREPDQL